MSIMSNPTQQYSSLSPLGKGAFGEVYKAKDNINGNIVAIKKIPQHEYKSINRELSLLSKCESKYIIKLLNTHLHNEYYWIILEYCCEGSIECISGKCNEYQIKKITFDVLNGLFYLHSNQMIHRDIKPSNILHSSCGTYKLADFGTSKEIRKNLTKTFDIGTPRFMAPEMIKYGDTNDYDETVDIWSLGVTLYKLITNNLPFDFKDSLLDIMTKIVNNHPIKLDINTLNGFSHEICDIINNKCLVKDNNHRYSAERLLKHSYFEENDNKHDVQTTLIAYCESIKFLVCNKYPSVHDVWQQEPKGTIIFLKAHGIIEAQQLCKEFNMPFKEGTNSINAWKEYKNAIYQYLTIINNDQRLKKAREILSNEIWIKHYKRFPYWPSWPKSTINKDVVELNKKDDYNDGKWFIVWSVGGSITVIDHRPSIRVYKAKFSGKPTLRVLKVNNQRLDEFNQLCLKNKSKAIEKVKKYVSAPLTWDSL